MLKDMGEEKGERRSEVISFIVRCWPQAGAEGKALWRGEVEHVRSGRLFKGFVGSLRSWRGSSPAEIGPWVATSQRVFYTPEAAGQYVFQLVVAEKGVPQYSKIAMHTLNVEERESQPQPSEIQEFALILGPDGELQSFPRTLKVSSGSLRLFLTSLDQAVTVVIRREGAEAGISTVRVEPGKLATVEVELAQGTYDLLIQGTGTVVGQIEAR